MTNTDIDQLGVQDMFGQRLRELRNKMNLSMKELGSKFGLAESTISGYENGTRKPNIDLIVQFADFFDVSIDYLLGKTNNPQSIINDVSVDYLITGKDKRNPSITSVKGNVITLTKDEYAVIQEMKKHPQYPQLIQDLASKPEWKIRRLIRMWKFIKEELEEEAKQLKKDT